MFYKGIVEDNKDDKQLGRVKVRIIGKHTSRNSRTNAEHLTVENLPWAMPISPIGASSISGICDFDVPVVNSIVVCGYFDPDEQELFYIGTLGLLGDKQIEGYSNPKSEHPNKKYPFNDLVNSNTDVFDNQLVSNDLFSEPQVNHSTIYPKNKVIATESGHVIELDDSDGAERIRIRHVAGSFSEYHEDGTNVEKTTKDKYLITQNLNIHTEVDCNLYSKGVINFYGESDINVYSQANINVESDADTNLTVHGTINVSCDTSITVDAGSDITVTAPMIHLNP